MRGKLIVLEGTDCSGKQTQTELLVERFKQENKKLERLSFPMYDTPTGMIIGGPFQGKSYIGESFFKEGASNVDPLVSSLYYMADRKYNVSKIEDLINNGINVILDRYTISNMAHQGGKIENKEERLNLYKWLDKIEYEFLNLPRPDEIVFLYVPFEYSCELKKHRKEALDDVEKSEKYLRNSENTYLELASMYNYKIINCIEDNKLKTIEKINDELYEYINQKI